MPGRFRQIQPPRLLPGLKPIPAGVRLFSRPLTVSRGAISASRPRQFNSTQPPNKGPLLIRAAICSGQLRRKIFPRPIRLLPIGPLSHRHLPGPRPMFSSQQIPPLPGRYQLGINSIGPSSRTQPLPRDNQRPTSSFGHLISSRDPKIRVKIPEGVLV